MIIIPIIAISHDILVTECIGVVQPRTDSNKIGNEHVPVEACKILLAYFALLFVFT